MPAGTKTHHANRPFLGVHQALRSEALTARHCCAPEPLLLLLQCQRLLRRWFGQQPALQPRHLLPELLTVGGSETPVSSHGTGFGKQ